MPMLPRASVAAQVRRQKADTWRGSAHQRGYGKRWQRARAAYLGQPDHALCVTCRATGQLTPATRVDHIVPHRGDMALFWDEDNWQPLCEPCHNRKTGQGA